MHSQQNQPNIQSLYGGNLHAFNLQMKELLSQNDSYRLQMIQRMNEIFELLRSSYTNSLAQKNSQHLNIVLSKENISNLFKVLSKVEGQLQFLIDQKDQSTNNLKRQLEQKKNMIQNMKNSLQQKKQKLQKIIEENTLQQQYKEQAQKRLSNSSNELQKIKDNKREQKYSALQYVNNNFINFEGKWQTQTNFLQLIIKKIQQLRFKYERGLKVMQMLQDKVKDSQQNYKEYTQKLNNCNYLDSENKRIKTQLNEWKTKNQKLLQKKTQLIFKQELFIADRVANKWQAPKTKSEGILLKIIDCINQSLPTKKLQSLQLLMDAAQTFYGRKSRQSQNQAQRQNQTIHQEHAQIQNNQHQISNSSQSLMSESQENREEKNSMNQDVQI